MQTDKNLNLSNMNPKSLVFILMNCASVVSLSGMTCFENEGI